MAKKLCEVCDTKKTTSSICRDCKRLLKQCDETGLELKEVHCIDNCVAFGVVYDTIVKEYVFMINARNGNKSIEWYGKLGKKITELSKQYSNK